MQISPNNQKTHTPGFQGINLFIPKYIRNSVDNNDEYRECLRLVLNGIKFTLGNNSENGIAKVQHLNHIGRIFSKQHTALPRDRFEMRGVLSKEGHESLNFRVCIDIPTERANHRGLLNSSNAKAEIAHSVRLANKIAKALNRLEMKSFDGLYTIPIQRTSLERLGTKIKGKLHEISDEMELIGERTTAKLFPGFLGFIHRIKQGIRQGIRGFSSGIKSPRTSSFEP